MIAASLKQQQQLVQSQLIVLRIYLLTLQQ
jgi:hypothetical protein